MVSRQHILPGDDGYLPMTENSHEECGHEYQGWACTRTKKHEGLHAAHGIEIQYVTWNTEDEENA